MEAVTRQERLTLAVGLIFAIAYLVAFNVLPGGI